MECPNYSNGTLILFNFYLTEDKNKEFCSKSLLENQSGINQISLSFFFFRCYTIYFVVVHLTNNNMQEQ